MKRLDPGAIAPLALDFVGNFEPVVDEHRALPIASPASFVLVHTSPPLVNLTTSPENCPLPNGTENRGGVEILLSDYESLAEDGMGEMVCLDCASRLARLLKKRVKECREKQARGLRYRGDPAK